jgi:hypothetical protein
VVQQHHDRCDSAQTVKRNDTPAGMSSGGDSIVGVRDGWYRS